MRRIEPGSDESGRAFKHFLIEEVRAYVSYSETHLPLAYWRTSTGMEVDLIVGDLDAAPRRLQGGITVLPWKESCRRLWAGDLGV